MQASQHKATDFPDVTKKSWTAPEALLPTPGTSGWAPPSKLVSNPGASHWKPGSDLMSLEEAASQRHGASPSSSSAFSPRVIIPIAGAIILIALLFFNGTASLEQDLQKGLWTRHEDSLELELDFDKSTIEYSADAFLFSTTIARMDYKVISPFGMLVSYGSGWNYVSVEIDDGVLTISPAITKSAETEYWF